MTAAPANHRAEAACEPRELPANCLRTVREPIAGTGGEPCVPVPIRHRTVRRCTGAKLPIYLGGRIYSTRGLRSRFLGAKVCCVSRMPGQTRLAQTVRSTCL